MPNQLKQSVYFKTDLLLEILRERKRLDRSLSWIVQRCIRIGLQQIKNLNHGDAK